MKLHKPILLDGAMATYYKSFNHKHESVELANIDEPDLIEGIHSKYMDAGAKYIRTNTFSAYTITLNKDPEAIQKIVQAGYKLAKGVAENKGGMVICSLGPINENGLDEETVREAYTITINALIEIGAERFIFETFSETETIKWLSDYVLGQKSDAVIWASVAVNPYGYTKSGISHTTILSSFKDIKSLEAYGFNCAIGAGHMKQLLKGIEIPENFLVMPNAGYPEMILNRETYQDNSDYYANQMIDICKMGVSILGACCGTTPKHIEALSRLLEKVSVGSHFTKKKALKQTDKASLKNSFKEKLLGDQFVIAVELDPPHRLNIDKLMESANIIKNTTTDIITIADSPLGRSRLDSMMIASKIKREVGMDVMPHLCCRDKNIIAIRSLVMAGYIENIRNILLVTGDPIPQLERSVHKGVFNMNAIQLMELVKHMNIEHMHNDPLFFGGAFDPKHKNIERMIERVKKKKEAGADYLLTQPIYTEEEIQIVARVRQETGIKILGGILPLVSYKNAEFIHNEFAGMDIPKEIRNSFKPDMSREEAESVGINNAVDMGNMMKNYVDGFYFMTPFNRASMIKAIIEKIRT